jgi:hypothetical protein
MNIIPSRDQVEKYEHLLMDLRCQAGMKQRTIGTDKKKQGAGAP